MSKTPSARRFQSINLRRRFAVGITLNQLLPQQLAYLSPMQQIMTQDVHPQLHTEVHAALTRNPYFAGRSLRIEMRDDRVVLSGVLHSYFHKQMAQESILAIDGIHRVQNEIEVVSR